jgi:hypothetical protein
MAGVAGLAAMVLVAHAGCIGVNIDNRPARFVETRSITAGAAPAIAVRGSNGAIHVRTTDAAAAPSETAGQITIVARIAAVSPERLAAARVVSDLQDDGTLLITVAWPDERAVSNESCSFEITVPGALQSIRCNTSNGEVRVAHISGDATLGTSNGRIVVEDHRGAVHASTSNGAISMKRVLGDVEARTSNGAIDLSEVGGGVVALTSSGRVSLALAPEAPGMVRVQTSNGPVSLTLPANYAGRVSLSTSNGSIRVPRASNLHDLDTGRNHARFSIGEGNSISSVMTSNGAIELRIAQ